MIDSGSQIMDILLWNGSCSERRNAIRDQGRAKNYRFLQCFELGRVLGGAGQEKTTVSYSVLNSVASLEG